VDQECEPDLEGVATDQDVSVRGKVGKDVPCLLPKLVTVFVCTDTGGFAVFAYTNTGKL
jgi:hypothetical protein